MHRLLHRMHRLAAITSQLNAGLSSGSTALTASTCSSPCASLGLPLRSRYIATDVPFFAVFADDNMTLDKSKLELKRKKSGKEVSREAWKQLEGQEIGELCVRVFLLFSLPVLRRGRVPHHHTGPRRRVCSHNWRRVLRLQIACCEARILTPMLCLTDPQWIHLRDAKLKGSPFGSEQHAFSRVRSSLICVRLLVQIPLRMVILS
jgi:hypothetical protein